MLDEKFTFIEVKAKVEQEQLFKISRMKEVIKPSKPHRHDHYSEIILLTEGEGFHTIDLQKYVVQPGSIFYLHPGQVHCWEFTKIPKGFVLIFKDDFFIRNNTVRNEFFIDRLEINSHLTLESKQNDFIEIFEKIEKEYKSELLDKNKVICSYLQILLIKLKRLSIVSAKETDVSREYIIRLFTKELEQHFIHKKFVKDYADILNISPKHLNEICKTQIGSTASKLIHDRIILEAKLLLLHTNKTAAEIAYQLNFNDLSYFVKFFRKATGITPKDYRTSTSE